MMTDFLEELLNVPSVSGFESEAARLFCEHLEQYSDDVHIDILNNAYACSKGGSNNIKVMLDAHIDEIGMQVLYIDESGYLYVRRAGGVDVQCLPGTSVMIMSNDGVFVSGVIGKKPVHLMHPDEKSRTTELENIWIDTGMDAIEVKEKISIGAAVCMMPNLKYLSQNRISSKSLDDKVGVFIVAEVFKRLAKIEKEYALYAVASVQEEVGTRGIGPVAYSIDPDIAICIDVDFATDVPDCPKKKYGNIKLGEGVIITRNLDSNLRLSQLAEHVAIENGIPYQISARNISTGGNNTSRIQISRGGVQTLFLSIPCRYMHTPVEVCDLRDVESAVELLTELLKSKDFIGTDIF